MSALSAAVRLARPLAPTPSRPLSSALPHLPPPPPAPSSPSPCEQPLVFDTYRTARTLEASGLPPSAAGAVTCALADVSRAAQRLASAQLVTKSEFVSLRSELSILEKADFAVLKSDIGALEKRLETAVAEIYTAVEKSENKVIKWVVAVAGALTLGVLRVTTAGGQTAGGQTGGSETAGTRARDGPRVRLVHV